MRDVANKYCHWISCFPKNAYIPTVSGLLASEDIMVKANVNSFHAAINTKINAVIIPGADKGSSTLKSAWNLEHPSIHAACSSS